MSALAIGVTVGPRSWRLEVRTSFLWSCSESLMLSKDTLQLLFRNVYKVFVIEYLYNLQFLFLCYIGTCFVLCLHNIKRQTYKQKFMIMYVYVCWCSQNFGTLPVISMVQQSSLVVYFGPTYSDSSFGIKFLLVWFPAALGRNYSNRVVENCCIKPPKSD